MDAADYSEEQFQELRTNAVDGVVKIGFREKKTVVIPICAQSGENIIYPPDEGTTRMPWYTGAYICLQLNSLFCFFFNCPGTTRNYKRSIVGSLRWV